MIIGWNIIQKMKRKSRSRIGAVMMTWIGLLMRFLLNYAFSKFVDLVAALFKRRAKTALRNTKPPTSRTISCRKKP